jgi:hypothetical protein
MEKKNCEDFDRKVDEHCTDVDREMDKDCKKVDREKKKEFKDLNTDPKCQNVNAITVLNVESIEIEEPQNEITQT